MQFTIILLAAAGVSALPAPLPQAAPAPKVSSSLAKTTDKYAFELPLKEFNKVAEKKGSGLDWSTNGCSKPAPQNPLGFPFEKACERHDFGYRNYVNQGRMDEPRRKQIDERFRADMKDICAEQDTGKRTACKVVAETYFTAVRAFGASHAKPKKAAAAKRDDSNNVVMDEEAYAEYLHSRDVSDALVAELMEAQEELGEEAQTSVDDGEGSM